MFFLLCSRTGSKYDDEGFYRSWWSNVSSSLARDAIVRTDRPCFCYLSSPQSTVKAFQERADCLIKQYSKYTVVGPDGKEVHVDGSLTSGESELPPR